MGCGNGVIAMNLVRDLLNARPGGATALFVPAEITSYCFYPGAQKAFMVANAIFRMVGRMVGWGGTRMRKGLHASGAARSAGLGCSASPSVWLPGVPVQ